MKNRFIDMWFELLRCVVALRGRISVQSLYIPDKSYNFKKNYLPNKVKFNNILIGGK